MPLATAKRNSKQKQKKETKKKMKFNMEKINMHIKTANFLHVCAATFVVLHLLLSSCLLCVPKGHLHTCLLKLCAAYFNSFCSIMLLSSINCARAPKTGRNPTDYIRAIWLTRLLAKLRRLSATLQVSSCAGIRLPFLCSVFFCTFCFSLFFLPFKNDKTNK